MSLSFIVRQSVIRLSVIMLRVVAPACMTLLGVAINSAMLLIFLNTEFYYTVSHICMLSIGMLRVSVLSSF